MTTKDVRISVFFPCYNDKNTIGKLIREAYNVLKELSNDFEIIVVDDHSTDGSRELLNKLTHKFSQLKVVLHNKNQGYGGALRSGFKAATKDMIFYTDGDGQFDLAELPVMLKLLTPDIDFINGIRMIRRDPTRRVVLGNLYNFLVRWFFWIPLFDVDCDYRLIRRSLFKKIKLTSISGAICVELTKKAQLAGATFAQITVHHYDRPFGNSQFFNFQHVTTMIAELIFLWFELIVVRKLTRGAQ